jgi:DNA invertase Pin-like site-specific DNA recombinase
LATLTYTTLSSQLAEKGVEFKVTDDPAIDTSSRTGRLVMGILALIAEFENDIRHEHQMDGIAKKKVSSRAVIAAVNSGTKAPRRDSAATLQAPAAPNQKAYRG